MKFTQEQRLMQRLLQRPVCGLTRDPYIGSRIAARILDLKHKGFTIEAMRPCIDPMHAHRNKKQVQYTLVPADQDARCVNCGLDQALELTGAVYPPDSTVSVVKCRECGTEDLR